MPEKKFHDSSTEALIGGNELLLNGIAQGTGYDQRIGRNIMVKSIHVKWKLTGAPHNETAASFSPGAIIRVIIFVDNQPNGELASVPGDFLVASAPGKYPLAHLNMANSARFRVLFDKRYCVANANADDRSGWKFIVYDETYQKMNLKITYSNTSTGTISDIETNAIYAYVISDIIDGDNLPVLEMNARIRFVDN